MPPGPANDIEAQIEAAYDFRGHVTITFKNGEKMEGFIYNRQFNNPKLPDDNFIEVVLKDSGKEQKFPIPTIQSVELSGKDWAAVNPYIPPEKKS